MCVCVCVSHYGLIYVCVCLCPPWSSQHGGVLLAESWTWVPFSSAHINSLSREGLPLSDYRTDNGPPLMQCGHYSEHLFIVLLLKWWTFINLNKWWSSDCAGILHFWWKNVEILLTSCFLFGTVLLSVPDKELAKKAFLSIDIAHSTWTWLWNKPPTNLAEIFRSKYIVLSENNFLQDIFEQVFQHVC